MVERRVIDDCVSGCIWGRIEEFEEEGDETRLAAAGTTADCNSLACLDSEVDVTEG